MKNIKEKQKNAANGKIKSLISLYFDGIPYSEEIIKAKNEMEAVIGGEYQAVLKNKSECLAFEEMVKKYSTLSAMAARCGYAEEIVEGWRAKGAAKEFSATRKFFKKQRRMICGIAVLMIAALVQTVWFAYNLLAAPRYAAWNMLFAVIPAAGGVFLYRRLACREKEAAEAKYDAESYAYLRMLSDRYVKRRINSTALFFAAFTMFIMLEVMFFFTGNSKSKELIENMFSNIILIEIPIFLCLKNILCFRLIQNCIGFCDKSRSRRHFSGIAIFSAVYWTVVFTFVLMIGKQMINSIWIAAFAFSVLILLYNFTQRKKLTYQNLAVNKVRIVVFVISVILMSGYSYIQKDTWYTQPYINSLPVILHDEHKIFYQEETGIYTIVSSNEDFKILHLTDIHLGGSLYSYQKDLKALKAVYAEIEHTRPDLVIVTGDMVFPMGIMSLSLNNSAPVSQFAAFMRNVGIPWAFTYGNHDTESMATLSKSDLNDLYMSLSYKTSGNLLYPYKQPEITGRNNQLIEIRNMDGTLNQALFLIDSNAYTGEGINVYDYIHDDQVLWYENEIARLEAEEGRPVSSMAFFHIPLQEYRTAYELYEAGSDEVKYFFGKNGEKMIDKICCSDYPSKLFDSMVRLGSTKAVFCGHDHYNNMSLEYRGIRLTYGMSIDYLAMPGIENDTAQRGAELITLHSDSTWDLEQIPLESILN